MSTKGVVITKETPDILFSGGDTSITLLIANGVAVASQLDLDTLYHIFSVKDAETILGIDAAYDVSNEVVLHHHIDEFYRMARPNTKLYVYVVSQAVTIEQMVDVANNHLKAAINQAQGEAFNCMVAHNPDQSTYSPVMSDGYDADLLAAIPKAQGLVDYAFEKLYPTRIVLEGKYFTPPIASVEDLRNIPDVKAYNVSVVTFQDWNHAETNAAFNNYAAVGTFTGALSRASVHENVGWTEEFPLTDATKGKFLKAGFSNHDDVMDYEDDWDLLDSKGAIFAIKYPNVDGFYINDDHTCAPIEVDPETNVVSESGQLYGRTADKACLQVFASLISRVKSPQPVDPASGKLPVAVVLDFQQVAERRIDQNMAGEISGRSVIVDKNSNLLPPNNQLDMAVDVVPYGTAKVIRVKVALKRNL